MQSKLKESYFVYTKSLFLSSNVPFHVQGEMIGSRETSFAKLTLKRFDARMLAIMPRQFVGARKSPRATVPRTVIRFLARVRALVRFQVRTLRVDFVASRM